MPSVDIIEIEDLTQPIGDDNPCGIDLRISADPNSIYYKIKDARQAARAAERANMFDPDESSNLINNWKPVADLAPQILKENSKDLEIASWYLEALIRLKGFQGLATGLALIEQLIEHCWDGIYPLPDEDGLETTVNALAGLNGISGEGSLIAPMRNAPITPYGDMGTFNFWQYQQARDADKIADPDKQQQKIADLGYNLGDIEKLISQSDNDFCTNLLNHLTRASESFNKINQSLRDKCGDMAPPSSHIQTTLEEILRTFRHLAKDKLVAEQLASSQLSDSQLENTDPNTSHGERAIETPTVNASKSYSSTGVTNRDEAFRKMQEACDYFKINEPHTPLVSALERLIRWGHMPLHELMAELMPDPTARAFYTQLTGAALGSDANTATMETYTNTAQTPVANTQPTSQGSESTVNKEDEAVEDANEMKW